jgi:streptogramin lyase
MIQNVKVSMKARQLHSWVHSKRGVAAAVVVFLAYFGLAEAQFKKTADLGGLARASGTVKSPSEFKAARVYFRNPDKRMLYMVYTNAGKFQAMNLMPGNYEVSVQANVLESDVQKIELKAGSQATVNLSLHSAVNKSGNVRLLTYEEIYPKGTEGRKIAERTCVHCHGVNFLPSHQWNADEWNGAINHMMSYGDPPPIPAADLSKGQREVLVKFLVENFGPHSELRGVSQAGMPVDETEISKAEYIEFYFPLDGPGVGNNDPQYIKAPGQVYGTRRVGQDVVLHDGYAWTDDRGTPQRISRLDPRTGEWLSFLVPHPTNGVHDFTIDTDGLIWIPERIGKSIDVFDTKTLKWVSAYPMDPDHVLKGLVHAQGIVIDSKHNVYVNWNLGSAISRLDWQTKKATVTLMPKTSFLYGVTTDSKDNV